MGKAYRRAHNCGPVPYPDGSGKILVDEVVSGDEWEPLMALGYVVPHEDAEEPMAAKVELVPEPPKEPVVEPAKEELKLAGDAGLMQSEPSGTKSSNVAGEGAAGDKRGGRGGRRGGGGQLNG